jgi:hypothetical protein
VGIFIWSLHFIGARDGSHQVDIHEAICIFSDGTDNGERPGRLGLIPSEGFNVIAIRSWLAFGSFSPRRMYGTSFFLSFFFCDADAYFIV